MISIATQRSKPYTRLIHVAKNVFDNGRVLTAHEKEDFASAICDAIDPYDACHEMGNPDDQWDDIADEYQYMDEIDVIDEWLVRYGCKTLEEYILDNGMPIPSIDDMVEYILGDIDIEEYINEFYDDYIGVFFEQLLYNYTDEGIVTYFADHVKAEVYDD
jgi:hypothetical protein